MLLVRIDNYAPKLHRNRKPWRREYSNRRGCPWLGWLLRCGLRCSLATNQERSVCHGTFFSSIWTVSAICIESIVYVALPIAYRKSTSVYIRKSYIPSSKYASLQSQFPYRLFTVVSSIFNLKQLKFIYHCKCCGDHDHNYRFHDR